MDGSLGVENSNTVHADTYRAWPMCAASYTVGPQLYHVTRLPSLATNASCIIFLMLYNQSKRKKKKSQSITIASQQQRIINQSINQSIDQTSQVFEILANLVAREAVVQLQHRRVRVAWRNPVRPNVRLCHV